MSMTAEQIIKLLDAGFTKEEILQAGEKVAGGNPSPEPTPTPEPTPEPTPTPSPTDAMGQQMQLITETLGKVTDAVKAIQEANIRNSQMPQPESADDILAQIISPKAK